MLWLNPESDPHLRSVHSPFALPFPVRSPHIANARTFGQFLPKNPTPTRANRSGRPSRETRPPGGQGSGDLRRREAMSTTRAASLGGVDQDGAAPEEIPDRPLQQPDRRAPEDQRVGGSPRKRREVFAITARRDRVFGPPLLASGDYRGATGSTGPGRGNGEPHASSTAPETDGPERPDDADRPLFGQGGRTPHAAVPAIPTTGIL